MFGSMQYVQDTVSNVEECPTKRGAKLPVKAPALLKIEYRPEVDIFEELGEDEVSYYHLLIGVLRWVMELGHADICVGVSMMLLYLELPHVGTCNKCSTSLPT